MIYFSLLLSFIILWVAVNAISKRTGGSSGIYSNLYTWFVTLWIVQMIILTLPIFEYFNTITLSSATYMVAGHICFALGVIIAMGNRSHHAPTLSLAGANSSRTMFIVLAMLGIAAQLAVSFDSFSATGFSLSDRFDSEIYKGMRELQFTTTRETTLGKLIIPASILAPLCNVVAAYFAFCYARREQWARSLTRESILAIAAMLIVIADALVLKGGRMNISFLLFLVIVAGSLGAALRPRKTKPRSLIRKLALALPLLLLLSIASAFFQQFRGFNADPMEQMPIVAAATVAPELKPLVMSNQFLGFYMLQLTYLSSSTEVLNFYLELPKAQMPGPFYGAYSFNVVYHYLTRFMPGFSRDFWAQARVELFTPLAQEGRLGNVWPTLLRDLIGDFGRIGALLFLVMFGWAGQRFSDAYSRQPTPLKAVLTAYIRMICFFSGVLSLFYMPEISRAVLVLIVILTVQRFRSRRPAIHSQVMRRNVMSEMYRP